MKLRRYSIADEAAVIDLWARCKLTRPWKHVEAQLLAMGCPKLNLQVRSGNEEVLAFYRKLGYLEEERVSLGKRLIPDHGERKD